MIQNKVRKIHFHFLTQPVFLPHRLLLKQFISILFKSEKQPFQSVTFIFCSDNYLLSINNEFLGHNYYTDIITFNLAETKPDIKGEIYISVDRVRDNAKQLGVTFSAELTRVIFHGILHLCNYKDKSRSDIVLMRSKEDYYIDKYLKHKNVSRGTS